MRISHEDSFGSALMRLMSAAPRVVAGERALEGDRHRAVVRVNDLERAQRLLIRERVRALKSSRSMSAWRCSAAAMSTGKHRTDQV
jgi:hypothetical protein